MNRAERAEQALVLRAQGLSASEIAARMGISRSYAAMLYGDPDGSKERARKDSYRRPCPKCGTLMSGSDGVNGAKSPRLCLACEQQRVHDERKWTRETMIAAVHLWVQEYGRPPTATEWLRNTDRRFPAVSLTHPTGQKNRYGPEFNSWADLIEAAGYPRPRVGHKVNPRGKGANQMARTYIVLERSNRGTWREHRTEAYSPENAIEQVATHAGRYAVILGQYFSEVNVQPIKRFSIVRNGDSPLEKKDEG